MAGICASGAQATDATRWKAEASRVTIVRDDWGIAHIHGKTDADAVFGMIYAQCEDDFNRVETNYLTSLGRRAEAEGEPAIWQDLRQRLFIDPEDLKRDYASSPDWLRKLMDAWADGINYYLARHPETKPKVLTRFEPWMALSFTEGSIGGDIERVDLKRLQAFYDTQGTHATGAAASNWESRPHAALPWMEPKPSSSNGIAIAPSNTANHHALLLINPHTWFFFRSELQVSSDEGLNAYGAVTWGQFFVYQGFNDRVGWMHTSSNVDAVDEYLESIVRDKGTLRYRYGSETKPFTNKQITIRYKTPEGMKSRTFTAMYSLHGPVVAQEADRFVTIQLMNIPIPALEQSYLRTKARNYAEYKKTMELQANSSNNTVFADADGDIAYWQGNFIPKRDTRFDYTKPVDGSNPATNWQGLMSVDELPHLLNPKVGYLFNVNDSPWNGAGPDSLHKADFPAYVEEGIETPRGVHAMLLLAPDGKPRRDWTLETLRAAAYDSYIPWFARTVPALVKAYDDLPPADQRKATLAEQVKLLRKWDARWGVDSVETALGMFWGTELLKTVARPAHESKVPSEEWIVTRVAPDDLLNALVTASNQLISDFGTWRTPWGQINRFQRLTDDLAPKFTDAGASIPIPFVPGGYGSLAAFVGRAYPGTKRWYGNYGNSFVAVVEFGDKVSARAVTAGGESGNTQSRNFNDEAERYASGNLRDVYFYPDQLKGHTKRTYHPGD
ncbi:penicillin acylase family protein [Occallatibacter riparius]|uniref:Penicillin acylase family protein n=1 Tax=Occallatibacter riparius TaxID=1002689 RepID=A0A9J7BMY7_9BACT|nr:penicillin acylase family protein [Occallatibacter riparius]UWZ83999.1 penicillin acylase family protein [Occallatibacter riparius]